MSFTNIHTSGTGSEKFQVDSYGNGLSYNFQFGGAGTPMRNVFLQGEDAATVRQEFDEAETREPDTDTREIWLAILDPYL